MKPIPGKAGDLQSSSSKPSNTGKDKDPNSGLYFAIGFLFVTNVVMVLILVHQEKRFTALMPGQDSKQLKTDSASAGQKSTIINNEKTNQNGSNTNPA